MTTVEATKPPPFEQADSLSSHAASVLYPISDQVSETIQKLSDIGAAEDGADMAGILYGVVNYLTDLIASGSTSDSLLAETKAESAKLAQNLQVAEDENKELRKDNANFKAENARLIEKGVSLSRCYLAVAEEVSALEFAHYTSAKENGSEVPSPCEEDAELAASLSPRRYLSQDVKDVLFIKIDNEDVPDAKPGLKKKDSQKPGKEKKKEEGKENERKRHQTKKGKPIKMKGGNKEGFVKTWTSRHKGDKEMAIGRIKEHKFVYPEAENIPLGISGASPRFLRYEETSYEVEIVTELVIVHHLTGIYVDDDADKLNRKAKRLAERLLSQEQASDGGDTELIPENESPGDASEKLKVFYSVPSRPKLFVNGYPGPKLLAVFLYFCYVLSLPVYRIQSWLGSMGMFPCYGSLVYWKSLAARKLKPLSELLHQKLVDQPVMQGDETPGLINGEEEGPKKSYWWFYTTIKESLYQICAVIPHLGRSGIFAKEDLKGFNGTLCSDAYSGYNAVPGITRALCNNHARRKFYYAVLFSFTAHQRALSKEIMDLFDTCQKLETEITREILERHAADPDWHWTDAEFEERKKMRAEKISAIYNQIETKCLAIKNDPLVFDNCLLMRAVNYYLNNKKGLREFLEDGRVPFHNMRVEQTIKKFAARRRSTLFNGSLKGAQDDGINMTVIYTLEMNGLDVQKYLCDYFEAMRGKNEEESIEVARSFLPWLPEIQEKYKAVEDPRKRDDEFRPVPV